jgi:hypothetical protein
VKEFFTNGICATCGGLVSDSKIIELSSAYTVSGLSTSEPIDAATNSPVPAGN